MQYSEWFERYWRRPPAEGEDKPEPKTNAIYRLSLETGVGHMSIRRALDRFRVKPETAAKLVEPTDGLVSPETLVMAPSKGDLKPTGTDG